MNGDVKRHLNTSGESVPGTRTDHVKSLKGSGAGLLSEAQSAWTFHQEGKQADVKAERRQHLRPSKMGSRYCWGEGELESERNMEPEGKEGEKRRQPECKCGCGGKGRGEELGRKKGWDSLL